MAASGSDLGCSIVGNLCCLSRSLLVVDQVFFTWHPRRATASAQLLSLLADDKDHDDAGHEDEDPFACRDGRCHSCATRLPRKRASCFWSISHISGVTICAKRTSGHNVSVWLDTP